MKIFNAHGLYMAALVAACFIGCSSSERFDNPEEEEQEEPADDENRDIEVIDGKVRFYLYEAEGAARLTDYDAGAVFPACVNAMELYGDSGRAKEIVVRNGIAHPLFCPNVLKVLNE